MRQRTTAHARENDEGRLRGGMKVCENWRETDFFFVEQTNTANNVRPISRHPQLSATSTPRTSSQNRSWSADEAAAQHPWGDPD